MSWDQEFGERLRNARKAAGVSQEDLAEHLGLTRSSVANIEAARQGIRPETIIAAGRYLRVDPGWLLLGDGVGALPSVAVELKAVRRVAGEINRLSAQLQGLVQP